MNNKEQELFDIHMDTMYALFEELLERYTEEDNLTEAEEKFIDALINLHEFWKEQENK